MATTSDQGTVSTEIIKKGAPRQLTGTSFLTLEHVGYFTLVVLLPILLFCGAMVAIGLWSGTSRSHTMPMLDTMQGALSNMSVSFFDPAVAMSVTASLVVLAPLMYVLRRRTMNEYVKRPGYANRVGYKLPIYSALALLVTLTIGSFVQMLTVFLESLVNIGVNGVNIGDLYTSQFLPALLSFAIFGMATWYVLWFAKGKDLSRQFMTLTLLLSSVLAIALFVTALTQNHQDRSQNTPSFPASPIYDDYTKYQ